jgi:hypothetical protein
LAEIGDELRREHVIACARAEKRRRNQAWCVEKNPSPSLGCGCEKFDRQEKPQIAGVAAPGLNAAHAPRHEHQEGESVDANAPATPKGGREFSNGPDRD